MGNKVDMSEVHRFSEDLANISSSVTEVLKQINSDVEKIISMDSFSGEAADKAKSYYNNVHGITIKLFQDLWSELEVNLTNHIETFATVVDTDKAAIIESNYLAETSTEIEEGHITLALEESSVHKTIDSIVDICYVNKPVLESALTSNEKAIEIIKTTHDNLDSFKSNGKDGIEQLDSVMKDIRKAMDEAGKESGSKRFDTGIDGEKVLAVLSKAVTNLTYVKDLTAGYTTNRPVIQAAKDLGLNVVKSTDKNTGKPIYRISATEEALRKLGVEPDPHALRALGHKKNGTVKAHWSQRTRIRYLKKAPLRYYNEKTGKHIWSVTGERVVEKYPQLEAWNEKAGVLDKLKDVAKVSGKEILRGFKDSVVPDIKSFASNSGGVIKGTAKSLGPIGTGLSYYSNYNDAKKGGLSGGDAVSRAVQDTVIDTTVSTTVQATLTTLGTVAIPIPGVGTAIGAGLGVLTNIGLNMKFGKSKKSVMDRTKDTFHKVKGWFS